MTLMGYELRYQDNRGRGVVFHTGDKVKLEREMDKLARQDVEFNVFVEGVEGIAGGTFRNDEGYLNWSYDPGGRD